MNFSRYKFSNPTGFPTATGKMIFCHQEAYLVCSPLELLIENGVNQVVLQNNTMTLEIN